MYFLYAWRNIQKLITSIFEGSGSLSGKTSTDSPFTSGGAKGPPAPQQQLPSPPQQIPVIPLQFTPPQPTPPQPPAHAGQLPRYNHGKVYATKLLKESGQADVYEGMQVNNDNSKVEVALKIFRREEDWNDCKVEIMSLCRVSGHPNVMEVLNFFEVPKPCMVMRLIRGGDLMDFLKKEGALKLEYAVHLLRGIGQGLAHLHNNGIAHRDMKSPNILIHVQGKSIHPVLIDLGMGKRVGFDSSVHTVVMKGTFLWMAPEMMETYSSTLKIDIYALGIIMWEIFSGKVPFSEYNFTTGFQLQHSVCKTHTRPSIDRLNPATGVKPGHVALMQKCWAADPKSRPTATEFLRELEKCL